MDSFFERLERIQAAMVINSLTKEEKILRLVQLLDEGTENLQWLETILPGIESPTRH